MDKLPVGQLPDISQSSLDDEIMIITEADTSQLRKEKISNILTDIISVQEDNALAKGSDDKLFVTNFGNASNITEGTLPVDVLPESGVTADTYAYPSSVTVNAQGQVTAIEEGTPSGSNANVDLSNITDAGKEVIKENSGGDGFSLFDTKLTDRVLTGDEALGWALQGSLVTMTYPDAVNRIKEEYAEGTVAYIKQNLPLPEFTSNTTNGITVSDSVGHDDAYLLINGVSTMYTIGPWSSYWFNIDYDEQTYIKTYSLKADNYGETEYPSAWTLQANNGGDTDWVTLDTQTAQTFTGNQQKTYPVNSETSYRQYRIVFSDGKEDKGNGELSQISFDVDNIWFEYKTAVNGHLIADISQKTAIDNLFNTTGIADFYILDSTNNQFYLPRNKYFMQLTDSTALLNSYNEPGLDTTQRNGAGSGTGDCYVSFDASLSNSIYGNSVTVQPPSSNKLLYYKVGHTVTNSGSIDVANVLSDINLLETNKADKDLSNCTKPYITETYKNGGSWYRVWSDGWIEQAGRYRTVGANGQVYMTFIKNFNTTNYYINATQLSIGIDSGTGTWSVHTISVSGFYVRNYTDAASDISWYACGY